jgi:transcriptional regulator with XRE-family HTH domain
MKRFCPECLAKRRKRKGKTQAALARETGISQVSISAIERGKKEPRSGTLGRLASALECGVDGFFTSC